MGLARSVLLPRNVAAGKPGTLDRYDNIGSEAAPARHEMEQGLLLKQAEAIPAQ